MKNNVNDKSKRQSNLELLRCILMYMVVMLHYNNPNMGGGFAYATGMNLYWLKFLECLCLPAVNCFVLISAYFTSTVKKRTIKKPIYLLLMVIGYKLLCYLISVCLHLQPLQAGLFLTNLIPTNWFVTLFCVLYIISEYINPLFDILSQKDLKRLLFWSTGIFVLYPTILEALANRFLGTSQVIGLGTVTMWGSADGYTIVNFVFLYLIGGYLRKYPIKLSTGKAMAAFMVCTLCNFAMSNFVASYANYSNILVVGQAVFLFLAFSAIKLPYISWINTISKSSFGIYLIHTCTLFIVNFWGGLFHIQEHCQESFSSFWIHPLWAVGAMYVVCLIIDMLCRSIVTPLVRWLEVRLASIAERKRRSS